MLYLWLRCLHLSFNEVHFGAQRAHSQIQTHCHSVGQIQRYRYEWHSRKIKPGRHWKIKNNRRGPRRAPVTLNVMSPPPLGEGGVLEDRLWRLFTLANFCDYFAGPLLFSLLIALEPSVFAYWAIGPKEIWPTYSGTRSTHREVVPEVAGGLVRNP